MKTATLLFALVLAGLASADVVSASGAAKPLDHYWSLGTCAGRANEGLRYSWVEQLKQAKADCGYRYIRMHDLFNDDMFTVFAGKNGKVTYNWQYVDDVYDRLVEMDVKPFVELSFFPSVIAAEGSLKNMWYRHNRTYDPAKLPMWHDLIKAFAQHCVDRYGIEEVSKWYFEVWNEPNLNMGAKGGFADFGKSDYFQLYKAAAEAVKSVDKSLRVGGPATSNFIADDRHVGEILDNAKSVFYPQETINDQQWKGIWIEEFLAFCAKEKLPCDFITCHTYPTDYALDPETGRGKDAIRYARSVFDDFTWLNKTLAASAYPKAEIHITEWSTSPNSRDRMHDLLPPAAYIVRTNLECAGMVSSLMYWTFTDIFEEKGGGAEIFHGGFGQLNFQGIPKPSYHAYRMLNRLGDEMVSYKNPYAVTRHTASGKVTAIAFNYPDEYETHVPSQRDAGSFMNASPKTLDLTLEGLPAGAAFEIETLDHENGYSYAAWEKMGRPHSPTRAETAALKAAGWATKKEVVRADTSGRLVLNRTLTPWCVVLIDQL